MHMKAGRGEWSRPEAISCLLWALGSHFECSSVEVELSVSLLHHLLVGLFEVFGQDHISVLAHRLHTSFLSDRLDVSSRNLFRSTHEVFQVYLFTQVHLAR